MKTKTKIFILTIFAAFLTVLISCDKDDPAVAQSGEADILSFSLVEETGPAIINGSGATVHAEVQNGTGKSDLSPTITFSEGACFSPSFTLTSDFTNPVTIPVEAATMSYKKLDY